MKRICAALLPVLLSLLLCACSSEKLAQLPAETADPGIDTVMPEADASEGLKSSDTAMLYFRYYDEPFLASQSRTVTHAPTESYEYALVSALLEGPSSGSGELTALFPEGTRLLSTSRQGQTLFVTLSRELLNGYPDEPSDWQDDPAWAQEVPLRRELCIQSLVATVTENCDIDRVQVLVERDESDPGASLRLKQNYFKDGSSDDELTVALSRDESLILSPAVAMKTILTLWQRQDWTRLILYVEDSGESDDFVTVMENLPRIGGFSCTGGAVNTAGDQAVFTVTLDPVGQDSSTIVLRLTRPEGLWKITLDRLTAWQED